MCLCLSQYENIVSMANSALYSDSNLNSWKKRYFLYALYDVSSCFIFIDLAKKKKQVEKKYPRLLYHCV